MEIDIKKVMYRMEELYDCGIQEDGCHTRMAFSKEDTKARDIFMDYFRQIGIEPQVDPAGNIIARMGGKYPDLPAVVMGSHLDTVPDGGKYDGVLGCVGGLAVMEAYKESGQKPKHPMEVIVFTDEEGFRFGSGMFGSAAICGEETDISGTDLDVYGEVREQVLERFGISLEEALKSKRREDSIHCFLELHIEQGARLDKSSTPIGIVTSIAGVSRSEVQITGEANHSGSTAMGDRKDALVTAADIIATLPQIVKEHGQEFTVATVGTIKVLPGSVNVIAGSCTFSLEIRDQSDDVVRNLEELTAEYIGKACKNNGCSYSLKKISYHDPSPMTRWITDEIEKAVKELGIEYKKIPSGAFHDSLIMAAVFPTGMIFVPSVGGISHSRHEFTGEEDIQRGIEVLLKTVQQVDNMNLSC